MASANGFILEVNGFELRSYWPAPFYLLEFDDPDANDYDPKPWLTHCDDEAHALSRLRVTGFRAVLLDSDFNELDPSAVAAPHQLAAR